MDYEEQNKDIFGQETNFSDTIPFQPPTIEAQGAWGEDSVSAENILDAYLASREQEEASFAPSAPAEEESDPYKGAPAGGRLPEPLAYVPEEENDLFSDVEPTVVEAPERKRLSGWTVVWAISKYVWKLALGLVLAVGILAAGLIGYLTVTEYNPAYAENADRGGVNRAEAVTGKSFSILTFNTGYGGLGSEADFFMDGGEGVLPESLETVEGNVQGISSIVELADADFVFLQEVDTDSQRSFEMNQWLRYEKELKEYESRFALNYSCEYVPYPLGEPMGKINSGLATYSSYDIISSTRFSLPNGYTWPNRVANLKRCLLVTRIPIEDSEKQLVLVNVHMEAYDDGNVRDDQLRQLMDFIEEEYAKGNFVIAGGDFNSTFPDSHGYEVEDPEVWTPGILPVVFGGFHYAYDDTNPTCRLLNQAYDPDSRNTRYYVIDGFLVSPNITVDQVETLDQEFIYSDHNPVLMYFTLNIEK